MDPNANIAEQRECAKLINAVNDRCADDGSLTPAQQAIIVEAAGRLAELVIALDAWMSRGGFKPRSWE
jgi:hypothetical protein